MKGLNKVKMLDIRGCINLWNIPTINNDMTELEEFNAHYPFHCCKISSNSRSTSLFELDEGNCRNFLIICLFQVKLIMI